MERKPPPLLPPWEREPKVPKRRLRVLRHHRLPLFLFPSLHPWKIGMRKWLWRMSPMRTKGWKVMRHRRRFKRVVMWLWPGRLPQRVRLGILHVKFAAPGIQRRRRCLGT
nr:hypothetical protein Iba_chr09eCG10330 [Ipomoea batatas]